MKHVNKTNIMAAVRKSFNSGHYEEVAGAWHLLVLRTDYEIDGAVSLRNFDIDVTLTVPVRGSLTAIERQAAERLMPMYLEWRESVTPDEVADEVEAYWWVKVRRHTGRTLRICTVYGTLYDVVGSLDSVLSGLPEDRWSELTAELFHGNKMVGVVSDCSSPDYLEVSEGIVDAIGW